MVSTFTYCTIKPQTKLKKKQSFPLETNLIIVCSFSWATIQDLYQKLRAVLQEKEKKRDVTT